MNRSALIALLQQRQPHLPPQAVDIAVQDLITLMAETLTLGDRIEIRALAASPFGCGKRGFTVIRKPEHPSR